MRCKGARLTGARTNLWMLELMLVCVLHGFSGERSS